MKSKEVTVMVHEPMFNFQYILSIIIQKISKFLFVLVVAVEGALNALSFFVCEGDWL